mgnify:CR=1 FL=1
MLLIKSRFYIVIFCVLSCSVLLLGMSYSKNSNDSTDTDLIESSNNNFRVVYSTDKGKWSIIGSYYNDSIDSGWNSFDADEWEDDFKEV